jgi:hypothetical protein
LAELWGEDVSTVAYHFRELVAFDFLQVVEENRVKGSIEHVHEATRTAAAWEREWMRIPPIFKQHLAALTIRLGVEAVGAAIDEGRFESRDDAVDAQDTMRVDEQGAKEAMEILGKAVEALMQVGERAAVRLEKNEDEGFLVSYMTVGYEGAVRPV